MKDNHPHDRGPHAHAPLAVSEGAVAVGPEIALERAAESEAKHAADGTTTAGSEKPKDVDVDVEAGGAEEVNALSSLSRARKNVLFTCFMSAPASSLHHPRLSSARALAPLDPFACSH